jgi:hypothetical protein
LRIREARTAIRAAPCEFVRDFSIQVVGSPSALIEARSPSFIGADPCFASMRASGIGAPDESTTSKSSQ